MRARSTSRCTTLCAPSVNPHSAQPEPATWKSGIATMQTACSSTPHSSRTNSIMPNRLRCDSMTPFGMPVVPDV